MKSAWSVAQEKDLSSSQLLLLLTMREYSNNLLCGYSVNKLSNLSRLNKQTVIKCISNLLERGLIRFKGLSNKHGVKTYDLSCFRNDDQTNNTTANATDNQDDLWLKFIANRKAKGLHYLSKDDEKLIKQAISEAIEVMNTTYETVMNLVIERNWSFVKLEWVVQALSKQTNTIGNSTNQQDEIKQAYYNATQGNHTELALEVTKRLGEYEVRTTPEKYMLQKWVSTYKKVLQEIADGDTLQAMQQRRRQAYLDSVMK